MSEAAAAVEAPAAVKSTSFILEPTLRLMMVEVTAVHLPWWLVTVQALPRWTIISVFEIESPPGGRIKVLRIFAENNMRGGKKPNPGGKIEGFTVDGGVVYLNGTVLDAWKG